jgi:hypothetical protein
LHGILHVVTGVAGVVEGIAGGLGIGGAITPDFNHLVSHISGGIAAYLISLVASWVASGAVYILDEIGHAMSVTTSAGLSTSWFTGELGIIAAMTAAIALPLLLLAAVQALVRQDPSSLVRTLVVRLPLAALFGGVAVEVVALGLRATDALSGALLAAGSGSLHHFVADVTKVLLGMTAAGNPAGIVFAGFLGGAGVAVGAFLVWLELVVRSAAITVATLFLPLALAGTIWPATVHWARRLAETLAALVLSKLVIVAVLGLAAGELSSIGRAGLGAAVGGVALLAMAVLAPFALLRLVPAVEAGAVAHLEGLARRTARAVPVAAATSSVKSLLGEAGLQPAGAVAGGGGTSVAAGGAAAANATAGAGRRGGGVAPAHSGDNRSAGDPPSPAEAPLRIHYRQALAERAARRREREGES